MRTIMLPAALAVAGFTTVIAFQGVDPSTLPDDEGKALLTRACSNCHDLGDVTRKRLTPSDWKNVVEDMVARGVQADESDVKKLALYLSAHVGQVNVNRASEEDLKTVLALTSAEAGAIVKARSSGSTFKTLDDVKAVPGIDPHKLDDRADAIVFASR